MSMRKTMMKELRQITEANPVFRGKLKHPSIKSRRLHNLINQSWAAMHISKCGIKGLYSVVLAHKLPGTTGNFRSAFSLLFTIFKTYMNREEAHLSHPWYRLVESEHFPDPTGLRARIEQWTFGLHPACIKYFMSALDVPDVWKALLQTYFYSSLLHSDDEEILSGYGCHPKLICKNGMESLSRAGAIIYYASVFLYFWVFSTPVSFTRFHIKSAGDLEVYTLAVDKVPKE
ncbi:unnamed protein product [Prunus armeniaca]